METIVKQRRASSRDIRWPHTIATRIDDRTLNAIVSLAGERGEPPSTILRDLIETALGRPDVERSIRRRRTAARDALELASLLRLLRTMAAELCRHDFVTFNSSHQTGEFRTAMSAIQDACARLRAALGDDGQDP